MEGEFNKYRNDKICIDEIAIRETFNYKEPWNADSKHESFHNHGNIKDENVDDLTVVIRNDDLIRHYMDDKVSEGCINQESCDMKDVKESIDNCLRIKSENLTVVSQKTEHLTDCMDNKICIYETIISGGCIKEEPCNTQDESGSITHNVAMKDCEECGEEYDLYCLQCPMLIRILDSNDPNWEDNRARLTLPKNLIDIHETSAGVGIVALRAIPKGVVFGPFKGLDSTKDDTLSRWKLGTAELVDTKSSNWLNWMQFVKNVDQCSHPNLTPFQYEDELYYRSDCPISIGDELLVCWESALRGTEDNYWEPQFGEIDDAYACTLCCVGYKSISQLDAHNSTCIVKRNQSEFHEGIVQCDICKIYLDKTEYSEYHRDRCHGSDENYNFRMGYGSNLGRPRCHQVRPEETPERHIPSHNRDVPFACTLCPHKTTTKSNLKQHILTHNDKLLACFFCSYKATTNLNLKRHVATHNGDRRFACTLCPYKATTKSSLKQHIGSHNDDRPFACPRCPYRAKKPSTLEQHFASHNNDKPFACTLCTYKARTKSNMKQHMVSHNTDRPFACTLCPYKTTRNSILKQHMVVHNRDSPFACNVCPYKATSNSTLKRHIACHNDDKPFACPICSYKATSKSNLKLHAVIHNDGKLLACALCSYKATRNSSLKRHVATHNNEKPFACTFCPYKATRNSTMRQHLATHNGEKPFACALCPYRTMRNSSLKLHMATHNGDKPFACTLCPYRAKTKVTLKRHFVVHSEDRPFACTLCPFNAKKASTLKRHIAAHNGAILFPCTLCQYKATTKWNLTRHIAAHK